MLKQNKRKVYLSIFLMLCLVINTFTFLEPNVDAATKNPRGGMCATNIAGYTDSQLNTFLNNFGTTNAVYIRMDIAWSVVQPTSTTWNFAPYDRIVNAIVNRGFKVLALPTYCPSWANGGYSDDKYAPTAAYADEWATFVRRCAERYIPLGVDAWELWNEPNINAFWKPIANVANYTNIVLKPGSIALRDVASSLGKTITVLSGGMSPAVTDGNNINEIDFVTGIYNNGGKDYFNAIGHHPYCFPLSPYNTASYSAFQKTISIHDVMVANGDSSKLIWGTEFGYHTGSTSLGGVSQALQAQYLTEAYNRWSSWSYTGPLIWYAYQDIGTDPNDREQNFGLLNYNGTFKPAWQNYINAMASVAPPTGMSPTATPTPTPIPSGNCDLVVTDISWSPTTPVTGNAVTFKATIKNQGTGSSPSGIIHGVAFRLDGGNTTIWSDNYTTSIAPGASVTVTANGGVSASTWTATAGTHSVTAVVDDVYRITESNESNNSYSENITIANVTPTPIPSSMEVHSGSWGAKVIVSGTATWNNFYQAAVSIPTNTNYTASFWLKGSGKIRLRVLSSDWATTIATQEFTASSTWTQYSLPSFSTGSNTTLRYVISDSGNTAGTLYIDDCFMGISGGTNRLTNPGFESGNTGWGYENSTMFSIVKK